MGNSRTLGDRVNEVESSQEQQQVVSKAKVISLPSMGVRKSFQQIGGPAAHTS